MSEPKKSRLVARLLIAGVLLVTLSALALIGLFIASLRRPTGPVNIALRNSLVGTWVGENGVVLEFHGDGTATSRSSVMQHENQYFDWTVSKSELAIFEGAHSRSVGWMINRHVFNRPTDRYEVLAKTPDQFELLDIRSGKSFRFKKMDDAQAAIAP